MSDCDDLRKRVDFLERELDETKKRLIIFEQQMNELISQKKAHILEKLITRDNKRLLRFGYKCEKFEEICRKQNCMIGVVSAYNANTTQENYDNILATYDQFPETKQNELLSSIKIRFSKSL